MANQKDIKGWITINGVHRPLFEGETSRDVYNRLKEQYNKGKDKSNNKKLEKFRNLKGKELDELSDDVLYGMNRQELRDRGLNGSSEYQRLVEKLDLNDKPTVLSEKEFEAKAKNETLIYRGVKGITEWDGKDYVVTKSGEDIVNNIKYGNKTYIGDGVYGDGIYFTDSYLSSKKYAGLNEKAIATAFIDKSKASIINETKLKEMRTKFFKDNPDVNTNGIFRELSSFALYQGYNVISVDAKDTGGNGNYYNVLDRSILVMKG